MGVATGVALTAISIASTIYGGVKQSEAISQQGAYQKEMFETNAQLSEKQGEESIKIGERDAENLGKDVSRMRGQQQAGFAAGGVDVTTGNAADVQAETWAMGKEDQATIRANAWREAWGFRSQANTYRQQGHMAERGAQVNASNTLLSAGLSAFDQGLEFGSKMTGIGQKKAKSDKSEK